MSSGDTARIAIFASGAGSNALNIIQYFSAHTSVEISAIVCNSPQAGVLRHAERYQIPGILINRKLLNDNEWFLKELRALQIDFIVLAGFLLLIPEYLVDAFPGRIINIHPALLPKYGGKGMYGIHVHEAVKASGDHETGITIHKVNKHYDEGEILCQKTVPIDAFDSPDEIAQKVHQLEYAWYPQVIADWVASSR